MGMYTEIFFRAVVREEAAEIMGGAARTGILPEKGDPFFNHARAAMLFRRAGSAYFPKANHFEIQPEMYSLDRWSVSFRANIKNYEREIQEFFYWVAPHVCESGFIGYQLYEEDILPTLYYIDSRGALLCEVPRQPVEEYTIPKEDQ